MLMKIFLHAWFQSRQLFVVLADILQNTLSVKGGRWYV